MQGQIQGGKPVIFAYNDSGFDSGTLEVMLPDGEHFSGKYVNKNSDASMSFYGTSGGQATNGHGTANIAEGKIVAVLMGNRGNTMQCTMSPSNASMGMISDGVGQCQVSDGRKIDVIF